MPHHGRSQSLGVPAGVVGAGGTPRPGTWEAVGAAGDSPAAAQTTGSTSTSGRCPSPPPPGTPPPPPWRAARPAPPACPAPPTPARGSLPPPAPAPSPTHGRAGSGSAQRAWGGRRIPGGADDVRSGAGCRVPWPLRFLLQSFFSKRDWCLRRLKWEEEEVARGEASSRREKPASSGRVSSMAPASWGRGRDNWWATWWRLVRICPFVQSGLLW